MSKKEIYDIIIIGTGPAGLSVASIAVQKNLRALLIEEGALKSNVSSFSFSEVLNHYRSGGQSAVLADSITPIAQPMTVGGGLAINSGLFQRVSEDIYQKWDISKNKDWEWKKILGLYESIGKEMEILEEPENPISELMIKASNKLFWKYKKVPISSLNSRNNFRDRTISEVIRCGGRLKDSNRVKSVNRENGSWRVLTESASTESEFFAEKVYLAGGTIQTPALLKRSGLVNRTLFSLKYHPVLKAIAEFDSAFSQVPLLSSVQVKEYQDSFTLGSSVSTRAIVAAELSKSHQKFWHKDDLANKLILYCQWNKCPKTYIAPIHRSTNEFLFSPQWFQSGRYQEGILKLNEYCLAMGAKNIILNTKSISSVHTFSSFPLVSENEEISLDTLEVNDYKNIFVVDGSILPDSLGVNPQFTIMAFAKNIAMLTL